VFENRVQRGISGACLRTGCREVYLEAVEEQGAERYISSVFENRVQRGISGTYLRIECREVYLERV